MPAMTVTVASPSAPIVAVACESAGTTSVVPPPRSIVACPVSTVVVIDPQVIVTSVSGVSVTANPQAVNAALVVPPE